MERKRSEKALNTAYDQGRFSVDRRAFLSLTAASGVSAVGGALLAPAPAFADQGSTSTDVDEESGLPALKDGKVRFTVVSDLHVGSSSSFFWRDKFAHAFEKMYQMADTYDAHFIVGDTIERALPGEYEALAEMLNAHAHCPLGITMGNHEYFHRGMDGEAARDDFNKYLLAKVEVKGSFQAPGGIAEGQTDFDVVLGAETDPEGLGYHVIAVSPHSDGNDYYEYYGDRKDYISEHVATAAKEGAGRPIFLLLHHPLDGTVRRSVGDGASAEFGDDPTVASNEDHSYVNELCAKYPQLVIMTSHSHTPLQDPYVIYQDDGATVVNTATFTKGYYDYDWGMDGDGQGTMDHTPAGGKDASQGLLVEVDPANDNMVTISRLDFRGKGMVLGEPWVIEPAKGAGSFAYRLKDREEAAKAPLVEAKDGLVDMFAATSVNAYVGESSAAFFSVDTTAIQADVSGAPDDVVTAYHVTVFEDGAQGGSAAADGSADGALYDARFISDYFKTPIAQAPIFVRQLFGINLSAGTNYVLKVSAQSVYGKETAVGEAKYACDVDVVAPKED